MKSSQYLPAVDGLRAVAVLLTFFFHIYPGYLPGGFVGVDVFFAISGFLITSILVRETSANGVRALSKFYARRALRILPALVVCVAVTFLFLPSTLHQSPGLNAAAALFGFMNWLRALTPENGGSLGHTWSLSVEEQFYAIWALVIVAAVYWKRTSSLLYVAVTAMVAVAIWRFGFTMSGASDARTFNGLDTRADALMAGCALALLPPAALGVVRRLAGYWVIPIVLMVLIVFGAAWTSLSRPLGVFTFVAVLAVWILAGTIYSRGMFYRALASRPFGWLGRRSFSFYLWHLPIIRGVEQLTLPREMTVLPLLALSLIAAQLSYAFVERPFLELKTRFEPATAAQTQG